MAFIDKLRKNSFRYVLPIKAGLTCTQEFLAGQYCFALGTIVTRCIYALYFYCCKLQQGSIWRDSCQYPVHKVGSATATCWQSQFFAPTLAKDRDNIRIIGLRVEFR